MFTYFCIPETKGLSLEQVDLLYIHSTPRTSDKMRVKLIAEDVHAADHRAIDDMDGKGDHVHDEKV